ncbi:MAG: hypothetical protein HY849_08480 [Nitrosomonadales bacterium]|nr:hypothetical protein [Nitrosomonadales bacterium]
MKKPSLLQRLRAKKRNEALMIGITWYTEETWAQVKATAVDPECFEDSFLLWKAMATKARREFQRSGVRAVEFQIVPQDFFAWCALNDQQNNATARAEFVSEAMSAASESPRGPDAA